MNSDDKTNQKKHKLFEDTEDEDDDSTGTGFHFDEYHRIFPHYLNQEPTPIKIFKSPEENIQDIRTIVYYEPPKKLAIIETERILTPHDLTFPRKLILPIQYPTIWKLTKEIKKKTWDAESVDLNKDKDDYVKITDKQQRTLKRVMIDVANRMGIINKNIIENFAKEVSPHELKHYYALKCTSNNNYDEFLSLYIDSTYAQDPVVLLDIQYAHGIDGATNNRKDWMKKWTHANQRAFAERLIASIAMEEIFTITNSAVVAEIAANENFPGLVEGTARFRDEQETHYRANLEINWLLTRNASPMIAREIIKDATEYEIEYATSMNFYYHFYDKEQVVKTIMNRADEILNDLNLPKIFNLPEEPPKYRDNL